MAEHDLCDLLDTDEETLTATYAVFLAVQQSGDQIYQHGHMETPRSHISTLMLWHFFVHFAKEGIPLETSSSAIQHLLEVAFLYAQEDPSPKLRN